MYINHCTLMIDKDYCISLPAYLFCFQTDFHYVSQVALELPILPLWNAGIKGYAIPPGLKQHIVETSCLEKLPERSACSKHKLMLAPGLTGAGHGRGLFTELFRMISSAFFHCGEEAASLPDSKLYLLPLELHSLPLSLQPCLLWVPAGRVSTGEGPIFYKRRSSFYLKTPSPTSTVG